MTALLSKHFDCSKSLSHIVCTMTELLEVTALAIKGLVVEPSSSKLCNRTHAKLITRKHRCLCDELVAVQLSHLFCQLNVTLSLLRTVLIEPILKHAAHKEVQPVLDSILLVHGATLIRGRGLCLDVLVEVRHLSLLT